MGLDQMESDTKQKYRVVVSDSNLFGKQFCFIYEMDDFYCEEVGK